MHNLNNGVGFALHAIKLQSGMFNSPVPDNVRKDLDNHPVLIEAFREELNKLEVKDAS